MPCELMFGLFSLLKECGETVGEEENYVKMKKKERRKGEKEQERKE